MRKTAAKSDEDLDVDVKVRKNGSRPRSESHNCINLLSGSSRLLGFAFTSSLTLRLRRQRDSVTLKAVSHPRRVRTLYHAATYCYANEITRLSCNCTISHGLFISRHFHRQSFQLLLIKKGEIVSVIIVKWNNTWISFPVCIYLKILVF